MTSSLPFHRICLHREGLSPPLAYTPLSEAWSDHLFYFSTLTFKRSGNYTVSFLVEVGFNSESFLSNVKEPLNSLLEF